MKKIGLMQVKAAIDEALATNKKNILFVSRVVETDPIISWFEEHPEYTRRSDAPLPLYEKDERGGFRKVEGVFVMYDDALKELNKENAILFLYPFGEQCIYGFDQFVSLMKDRFFVNDFHDGTTAKHSVEKLKLFIAVASHPGQDGFALGEQYYDLFDEVYVLDYFRRKKEAGSWEFGLLFLCYSSSIASIFAPNLLRSVAYRTTMAIANPPATMT